MTEGRAQPTVAPRRGRPPAELRSLIRERLLEAAWRVLVKHGFDGFSIDKVARRARASKATLYARFPGRNALLRAALEHELERSILTFPQYERGTDIVESLVSQCLAALRQLASPDGRTIERLVEWLDAEGSARPIRHTIHERALANTVRFIEAATRDGLLTGDAVTAQLWFEGLVGHAKLTVCRTDIDWTQEEAWARAFIAYHLAATGYRAI